LAPSEGVKLGLLRFSRQGVDESLETPCVVYDTVPKTTLSIMDYNTFLPKRAKGVDEHVLGRWPRSRRTGLLHGRVPCGVGVASNDRRSLVRYKGLDDTVLVCHGDSLDALQVYRPSGLVAGALE
jgi:hypothetical protein